MSHSQGDVHVLNTNPNHEPRVSVTYIGVNSLSSRIEALEEASCDHGHKITTLEDAVLWTPRLMCTSLWLDSDLMRHTVYPSNTEDYILTESGKVSKWTDSNNSIGLSQDTADDRPAYEHKCILDNAVVFDSTDKLEVTPDSQPHSDASGEYLVVMVLKSVDKSDSDVFTVSTASQDLAKIYVSNENISCKTNGGAVCDTPASSEYSVLSFLQSSESLSIYEGGAIKSSVTHVTSDMGDITKLALGSGAHSASSFAIKELVFLNWSTCTGDRQSLEGYMAHKWGFEKDLFAEHPFKIGHPVKTKDQITCGYGGYGAGGYGWRYGCP